MFFAFFTFKIKNLKPIVFPSLSRFREQRNWSFLLCFSCLLINSGIRSCFFLAHCHVCPFDALSPYSEMRFLNSGGIHITEWKTVQTNGVLTICFTIRLIKTIFQWTISSNTSERLPYDFKTHHYILFEAFNFLCLKYKGGILIL